jgi:cell division septation protein DedD
MGIGGITRHGLVLAAALAAAGCGMKMPGGEGPAPAGAAAEGATEGQEAEAPKVFSTTEAGLWDGRPSLGGIWLAYPGVKTPERVMIRNLDTGKSVVGALFRRERDNPGPKLQVSSEAAAELGMLPGAPAKLSVVALRRAEAPAPQAAAAAAPAASPAKPAPQPAAQPSAKPSVAKPNATGTSYVQIGIFSVEANAERAAERLRKGGQPATVRSEKSQGKAFWSVLAGPGDRDTLLKEAKALGYADAYAVKK